MSKCYVLRQAASSQITLPATHPKVAYPFAPGRLLVKFRDGLQITPKIDGFPNSGRTTLDSLFALQHVQAAQSLFSSRSPLSQTLSQIYLLELPTDSDISATVEAFAKNPDVEWTEPDYLARAAATPNDPLYPQQWALAQIAAPDAWDVVTGAPSVVIAVLDSGVDVDHPDMDARLWTNPGENPTNGVDDDDNGYVDDVYGWNFIAHTNEVDDDYGHGTQVVGAAVAETDNNEGIAGVCWNCRLMTVKVMQPGGVANYSDIALGVYYATNKGADVINLSLGGYANSHALQAAIEAAAGTVVIVAAAGDDNVGTPFYPAAYPEVLAVGGTTATDTPAAFSNYGDWVDVAAPAVNITTTINGGSYGTVSGTSLSAPFVSGLAGLVWTQHPEWTPAMVRAQIIHTADAIPATGLGSGRVNASHAVTITPHPLLVIDSIAVNGNPLERPAPGADATLTAALANDWLDASGVTGALTTTDPYVTIITSTATFGDIPSGEMGTGSPLYGFSVATGAGYNHPILFNLHVTANGGAYTIDLPLTITTRSANQNFCGTIASDQVWTNDKTFIVTCNVGIAPGYSLTIQPGTTVKFNGNYSLNVGGVLVADGTENQPIRFMSNTSGSWGRIYFDDTSLDATTDVSGTYQSGNILRWVHIKSAGQGIGCNSATPYLGHVTLTDGGLNCTPGATTLWVLDSTLVGGLTIGSGGQVWGNKVTGSGVSLSGQSTVCDNTIGGGISTGSNSLVQNNTTSGAINAPGASTVLNNIVSGGGISAGDLATVQENQIDGGNLSVGGAANVLTNTVTGSAIILGAGSLARFNNVKNASAWGISTSGSVTLLKNRVVDCANGVNLSGGLAQGNLIANSTGIGLQLSGSVTVISNTLTGNGGNTIVIASGAPSIHGNNLEFNTGTYNLVNNTANAINASGNWWGTTDNGVIDGRIFDY